MNDNTALIFPGQGSQEVNMGRKIAEFSKDAMGLWEKAERISALPLRAIYWESNDSEIMANTRYLQPALTVVNITSWHHFFKKLNPKCVAGHSLGELSACVAANVLLPEDAIELASIRGMLMEEVDDNEQGSMAAILRLTQKEVEEVVKDVTHTLKATLVIANYNTPTQFVISGRQSAVLAATKIIKEKKGRVLPLAVSGAFHSPLMKNAAKKFTTYLAKKTWLTPSCPIYSNSTGIASVTNNQVYQCLLQQMISPVYWIETIIQQWNSGIKNWIEIGSKGILSRMVEPILESVSVYEGFSSSFLKNEELVGV